MHGLTYAGEGTVVPEVTLVGEAVTDEAELALLGVLLDGVEEFLLRDLDGRRNQHVYLCEVRGGWQYYSQIFQIPIATLKNEIWI